MFVKQDAPRFVEKVEGTMPGTDGDAFSFKASFLALGEEARAKFDMATGEGTIAFLNSVLVGFDDIVDAGGAVVPFSDEMRNWLIDQVHTRVALVKGYFAGVYKAKLGN